MKQKSLLIAAFLFAFAAANTAALANDEHHNDAKGEKAEAAKTEKAAPKKAVKKHNHQQEKTGIPPGESTATSSDHGSMKNMHDHTKDRH